MSDVTPGPNHPGDPDPNHPMHPSEDPNRRPNGREDMDDERMDERMEESPMRVEEERDHHFSDEDKDR